MLPVLKPTAELKICGEIPQSSVRGLELDPQPLLVPYNQLKSNRLVSRDTALWQLSR